MVKGNVEINKRKARRVKDGKVVKKLPKVNSDGDLVTLFSVKSPTCCKKCGAKLNVNKTDERYVISSYGILEIPVKYWECSNDGCTEYYSDNIVGVTGSNNYSDEYLDKLYYTRYEAKNSLFNTQKTGEIMVGDLNEKTRAACPATLWRYDQQKGKASLEKLRNTDVQFDGTIYCDGYWIKDGWKKYVEKKLGKELDEKEWKKLRHKVIYVAATSDKVILDFQITDPKPPYFALIPLFSRIKERLGGENIKKIVSDEESAIINAVNSVLPEKQHSFCVYHQLKNLSRIYLDKFGTFDKVPRQDNLFYETGKKLIMAKNAVQSTNLLKKLEKMLGKGLTSTSEKAMKHLKDKYKKNRKLLEKNMTPETNNVMEQLYSYIDDFAYQAKSFKTLEGLKNWASNLFHTLNQREFNTGKLAGLSPLQVCRKLNPG